MMLFGNVPVFTNYFASDDKCIFFVNVFQLQSIGFRNNIDLADAIDFYLAEAFSTSSERVFTHTSLSCRNCLARVKFHNYHATMRTISDNQTQQMQKENGTNSICQAKQSKS